LMGQTVTAWIIHIAPLVEELTVSHRAFFFKVPEDLPLDGTHQKV
jgi:hypothetical protein